MSSEEILKTEFDKLREEILAKYIELGMRASGEFEKDLENKTSGLTGLLIGSHYAEYLEGGREPGGWPPVDVIKKWIVDKGIVARVGNRISVNSLAFLIGRKIAREGWKREKHGGVDLISQVITPERVQSIINKVTEFNVNSFTSQVSNIFKEFQPA